MNQTVANQIKSAQPYATDLLRGLTNIPTINPPGENYGTLCERLSQELDAFGLKHRTHRVPKAEIRKHDAALADHPRPMVVGRWAIGRGVPTVHFNAHYDVVRVGDGWTSDPFSAVVKKGRMYGRGTSDMKAAIVAMFVAVRALREAGMEPACNVELSFTPDEETGGD